MHTGFFHFFRTKKIRSSSERANFATPHSKREHTGTLSKKKKKKNHSHKRVDGPVTDPYFCRISRICRIYPADPAAGKNRKNSCISGISGRHKFSPIVQDIIFCFAPGYPSQNEQNIRHGSKIPAGYIWQNRQNWVPSGPASRSAPAGLLGWLGA